MMLVLCLFCLLFLLARRSLLPATHAHTHTLTLTQREWGREIGLLITLSFSCLSLVFISIAFTVRSMSFMIIIIVLCSWHVARESRVATRRGRDWHRQTHTRTHRETESPCKTDWLRLSRESRQRQRRRRTHKWPISAAVAYILCCQQRQRQRQRRAYKSCKLASNLLRACCMLCLSCAWRSFDPFDCFVYISISFEWQWRGSTLRMRNIG